MKVTTERTPDCNAVVTVEVDEEQINRGMKTAAQRISRARPMPGFRPGKAPFAVVERAVGKEALREEAIEQVAQDIYKQVLKDENIDPYDAGKMDVQQKEPLIIKFTIPTRPIVTLGDYTSIHMRPTEVAASDEEVNQVLERFRMDQAQMVPVTRPIMWGDLVTADVKGGLEGQEPTDNKALQIQMDKDKPIFPWIDQLIGVNSGEEKSVTYTYPVEEANTNLAGKTATYTVTVGDIKEPHLPAADNELAKTISTYETLDQLKGYIRTTLLKQKQSDEDSRFADQVIDAVVAQSEIAYPASMLDDEIDQEVERSKDLSRQLGLTWAKYLELSGKTEEEFRTDARPRAEKRLKRLLVILKLVEAENVQVTGKEVDVEIDRRAQEAARSGGRADQMRRTLSSAQSRRDIEFSLKMGKAIDRMVLMAKGEPVSGKILTPEMVREEERARELAQQQGAAPSGGLITDPSQVRPEDWPRGLNRPLVPGEEK